MVEISDKESIIKYINSKRDKENEYFFDGTDLLMQDHIYYSSLKNFIVTLTDFEIGAIRVGTPTIKETFEIINFIKGKVIENGFVKISINQNNKKLNSIIKRLKKQLTNCINYCDLEYEYLLIYKDKIIRNILSIDIDVLFDDMNIFQKYIDDTLTPRQSWQVVKWKSERDGLNLNYNPNYKVYKKILDIIKGKCINSLVFKIEEHDEIINVMKNNNCHYSDLYNIDFHHDRMVSC